MKRPVYSIILCAAFTALLNAQVITLTDKKHYQTLVIDQKKPTIIQFFAEWCGVCQAVKDSFNQLAEDPEFKSLCFARVNIDHLAELSDSIKIAGVPTFICIDQGSIISKQVGVQDIKTFKSTLKSHIQSSFKNRTISPDVSSSYVKKTVHSLPSDSAESRTHSSGGLWPAIKELVGVIGSTILSLLKSVWESLSRWWQ